MKTNTIITIGRQYGSGGREIALKLSQKLEIPFYDKELLKIVAEDSGICEDIISNFDEKPTNSFLYSVVMDPMFLGYTTNTFEMPLNQKVFLASLDTIRHIAKQGPCVIVGRCADYALEENKNCANIFIQAPIDIRVKRVMEKDRLEKKDAKAKIQRLDKQRSSYYNYYTSKRWGDLKSYHLCVDSNVLGIDGTVELLEEYISLIDNNK